VSELRRKSTVVIMLAAVEQSFSMEADFGDFEVIRETVQRAVPQVPAGYGSAIRMLADRYTNATTC